MIAIRKMRMNRQAANIVHRNHLQIKANRVTKTKVKARQTVRITPTRNHRRRKKNEFILNNQYMYLLVDLF